MTTEKEERALSALLAARQKFEPELPEELLRKAYAIQCKHQFDREHDISLREMQRLLEDFSSQQGDGTATEGGKA